jgi:hypothetical protein
MRKVINHHQQAEIALAAMKGDKTFIQLGSEFDVHPSRIEEWQEELRKGAPSIFARDTLGNRETERIEQLQKIIGRHQEEIDWLKKNKRVMDARRKTQIH